MTAGDFANCRRSHSAATVEPFVPFYATLQQGKDHDGTVWDRGISATFLCPLSCFFLPARGYRDTGADRKDVAFIVIFVKFKLMDSLDGV